MKTIFIINVSGDAAVRNIEKILGKKYKVILFTPKYRISGIIRLFKDLVYRNKYDILIGISSSANWRIFLYYVFSPTKEKIYFPYDITNFYPKFSVGIKGEIIQKIQRKLEEVLFRISNKIIHKGMENELKYLKFYDKIKNKPEYLFREFLKTNEIQRYRESKKLSKKDNVIHLVYVGGLYLKERPETESFWKFYPKITKQKLHLHIYSKQPKEVIEKFRVIEKKDPYFHYEGFKDHDDLLEELTKYDYGIHIFGKDNNQKEHLILEVAFANKNYDYLAAGLPIICSKELKAVSEFVEKNKLGLVIHYNEIELLKEYLRKKKIDYQKIYSNRKEFIDFIEKW